MKNEGSEGVETFVGRLKTWKNREKLTIDTSILKTSNKLGRPKTF